MRVRSLSFRVVVLVGIVGGCQRSAPVHMAEIPGPAGAADVSPVPVIELRGDGAAIGKAHGARLGEQIRMLQARYLGTWFKNPNLKFAAQSLAVMFEAKLEPRHREEIHALAVATGIDERDVMLGNCFLDVSPMTACSTIALPGDASPDGVARFGRNLDFPSFNVADKCSVLMIYHPAGKNAFAAVVGSGCVGVRVAGKKHGGAMSTQ